VCGRGFVGVRWFSRGRRCCEAVRASPRYHMTDHTLYTSPSLSVLHTQQTPNVVFIPYPALCSRCSTSACGRGRVSTCRDTAALGAPIGVSLTRAWFSNRTSRCGSRNGIVECSLGPSVSHPHMSMVSESHRRIVHISKRSDSCCARAHGSGGADMTRANPVKDRTPAGNFTQPRPRMHPNAAFC
jgi:hypothetical protein